MAKKTEGKAVHFYFCESKPELDSVRSEKLSTLSAEAEQFSLIGALFYLCVPEYPV